MPKTIKFIFAAIVVILAIGLGLLWENSFNLNQPAAIQPDLLALPQNLSDFEIQTDANRKWHAWQEGEKPRYLKSLKPSTIVYKGDVFVSVTGGTVFKFVEINENLAHIKLITGVLAIDKRFSPDNVFLQAQNVAIIPEPFSYGLIRYQADKIELEALIGNQIVKELNQNRQVTESYLFAGQELVYDQQITNAPPQKSVIAQTLPSNLPQINVDNYLIQNSQTVSNYKRQSGIKIPQMLEIFVINSVKKNAAQVTRLIQDLDTIREQTLLNQEELMQKSLTTWRQDFNNLSLLDSKITANALKSWLQLYGSFDEDSPYYQLKSLIVWAGGIVLSPQDLRQTWSYALESSANWDGATVYFSEVIPDTIKSNNVKAVHRLKERLYHQVSLYPQKNTVAAVDALAKINTFLAEKEALDYEQELENLIDLIATIQTFADKNKDGQLTHQQAVEAINAYITLIERYLLVFDATIGIDNYLAAELPDLAEFLRR